MNLPITCIHQLSNLLPTSTHLSLRLLSTPTTPALTSTHRPLSLRIQHQPLRRDKVIKTVKTMWPQLTPHKKKSQWRRKESQKKSQ